MKYFSILYLLVSLFLLSGCKEKSLPKGEVKATVIEYKVHYLSDKAGSIPTKMLPGKMTTIFADRYALNSIEGFFGQFSLIYIANLKNESVVTMLKLFDKKYVYHGNSGELPCGFSELKNLEIKETGKEIDFLGFNCKELLIKSDDKPEFLAACTDKIKVKNPNITTPYKDVNTVFLEFNTQLSMLDMRLSAMSVEEKTISWDMFRVPPEYKEKSKNFMDNTINELFK